MPNPYFSFKEFTVFHDSSAMKVTTDSCLFGAWAAREIGNEGERKSILDIGTGTGLLALMIAQKSQAVIDAVEIDPDAANQAQKNKKNSPFDSRITIIEKNILEFNPHHTYEIIVSNPPFYEQEWAPSDKGKMTAHHSEHLKLEQVFHVIARLLDNEGRFFMLLPYKRINELDQMLKKNGLFVEEKIEVRQSPTHQPFRLMISGGKHSQSMIHHKSIIIQQDGNYTPEFTTLLKDYYLYL